MSDGYNCSRPLLLPHDQRAVASRLSAYALTLTSIEKLTDPSRLPSFPCRRHLAEQVERSHELIRGLVERCMQERDAKEMALREVAALKQSERKIRAL